MSKPAHALRPFMAADTMALRDLFAQSIEELTAGEYDDDQRLAWAASAADADEFREFLAGMLTLVVRIEGEYAGFGSLKDNNHLEMLFVHPYYAGQGVGTTIADALERLAAARGAKAMTVAASDTAQPFFKARGYVVTQRNTLMVDDQWLANTTMTKKLGVTGGLS